jgi:uncharacterized membrane protein
MEYRSYRPLRSNGPNRIGPGLAPPPPPKRTPPQPPQHRGRGLVIVAIAAVFVMLCVAVATGLAMRHNNSPAAASTAPAAAQVALSPQAPLSDGPVVAPVHPKTLVSIDGKGAGQTQTFTTGEDWYLRYSYDCGEDLPESRRSVQIFEYSATIPGTMIVNESDQDGTDTLPQHGPAGPRYLRISSECDWTVTVLG